MKDEIKEILEDIKRHLDYVEATKQASIRDNEMKVMYDYITTLQEENKKLRCRLEDENKNYKRAIEYLHEENQELKADYGTKAQIERDTYKTRNEKAIEYIEEHIKYEHDGYNFYSYHLYNFNKDDLLNLLQGKSDE